MYRILTTCMVLCILPATAAAERPSAAKSQAIPDYTKYSPDVVASVARRVHVRMIKAETQLADANKRIEQLEARLAATKEQLEARQSQMRQLHLLAKQAGVTIPQSLVATLSGKAAPTKGADTKALEAAARKQLGGKLPDDEKSFLKALRTLPAAKRLIRSVKVDGDTVTVVVLPTWQMVPYQMRLQAAQEFQKMWGTMHFPDEPGRARIKLVDMRKATVGGSSKDDPAKIWVSK